MIMYVAQCPLCSHAVGAVTDAVPREEIAAFVLDALDRGDRVTRHDVSEHTTVTVGRCGCRR